MSFRVLFYVNILMDSRKPIKQTSCQSCLSCVDAELDVVVHAFNPSTWEAGGAL